MKAKETIREYADGYRKVVTDYEAVGKEMENVIDACDEISDEEIAVVDGMTIRLINSKSTMGRIRIKFYSFDSGGQLVINVEVATYSADGRHTGYLLHGQGYEAKAGGRIDSPEGRGVIRQAISRARQLMENPSAFDDGTKPTGPNCICGTEGCNCGDRVNDDDEGCDFCGDPNCDEDCVCYDCGTDYCHGECQDEECDECGAALGLCGCM